MQCLLLSLLLLPAGPSAETPGHFDLLASYEAPKEAGGVGAVAVTFRALDPDVRLNEKPPPRLQLELTQDVLVDRQPPAPRRTPDWDPLTARYLDLSEPVRFPVAISPTAPAGTQTVGGQVVFFYCSVREAWCRRGAVDVDVEVEVP